MSKEETKKTTTKKNIKEKKGTPSKKKEVVSKTVKNAKKSAEKTIIQEENNYGRTLLAAVLIIVIFLGGYLTVQFKKNGGFNNETKYVATQDEKKFKNDYESLNGTTRTNGQKNKEIEIIDDNNIVYITMEEAAKMLDSGTGVIYFGFAACPWCRNAVPVLLNAMNSSELKEIYYVDIRPEDKTENDLRDTFTLNNKNKAKKTKDAEKSYYDVLLALANDLNDYVLVTNKGKKVNTGEKRLYAPTVVAVKEGVVVGFHEGTVEKHEKDENGELRDLTKDEKVTLLNTYSDIISKFLNDACGEDVEGC